MPQVAKRLQNWQIRANLGYLGQFWAILGKLGKLGKLGQIGAFRDIFLHFAPKSADLCASDERSSSIAPNCCSLGSGLAPKVVQKGALAAVWCGCSRL